MTFKSYNKSVFAWDEYDNCFYKINNESTLALSDLYFIEQQKKALLRNTILFAEDKLSNNALLWGARGNGKSSLLYFALSLH